MHCWTWWRAAPHWPTGDDSVGDSAGCCTYLDARPARGPECDWRCRRRRPRMLGLPPGADNVHLALYSRGKGEGKRGVVGV